MTDWIVEKFENDFTGFSLEFNILSEFKQSIDSEDWVFI